MKNNQENKGLVMTLPFLYKCAIISLLIYLALRLGNEVLTTGRITFGKLDLLWLVAFVWHVGILMSGRKQKNGGN